MGMKIAISVPDPLFEAGEALARQLKMSRSQLYSTALSGYLSARGATAVTERLNAIYATQPSGVDAALATAQRKSIEDEAW